MGKSSANTTVDRRETPLQAIVFADSFSHTFRPITLERPKVLCPIATVPLIQYTFETLATSGVEEIFLFCTSFADELQAYVNSDKRRLSAAGISVTVITSTTVATMGEALREIDQMHLIRSDPFILMTADSITNVNLAPYVAEHKARKKKEPNAIMTLLFTQNCRGGGGSLWKNVVIGVDESSDRLLWYDDVSKDSAAVSVPSSLWHEVENIKFLGSLNDCQVDICSPEMLAQFSDNFDYCDLRRDFVHNEAQNFELGNKFFAKVLSAGYGARVEDPRTYHAVSLDMLTRWTYPFVPDNNYVTDATKSESSASYFTYDMNAIYLDKNVKLGRSVNLTSNVLIGSKTTVASESTISDSIVGRNCKIGYNTKISGSHLWDSVNVEDNVTIIDSILCDNVTIRSGAVINRGCILSFNVNIGSDFVVREFSKLTTANVAQVDEFGDPIEDSTGIVASTTEDWNPNDVGSGGIGRRWTAAEERLPVHLEPEDEDKNDEDKNDEKVLSTVRESLMGCTEALAKVKSANASAWIDSESDDDGDSEDDRESIFGIESPEATFCRVVREMVASGEKQDLDNVFLEIKSYKFAQDRSFADCINAIVTQLLTMASSSDGKDTTASSSSSMAVVGKVKEKMDKWASVLSRCVMGPREEMCIVKAMETFVNESYDVEFFSSIFRFFLQTVYDSELVSEETILEWASERRQLSHESAEYKLATEPQVCQFIEWLEEDDDDSSGSEDSD